MASKRPIRILLDADYVIYSAGFAAQHTQYLVTRGLGDEPINAYQTVAAFADKPATKKALAEMDEEELLVWERTTVEPVENALHTVKLQLNHIQERVEERFERPVELEVYLTGTGNFREKIATIRPYKGNRPPWHKPRLFREIRAYLIDMWGAEVIHDMEADDKVCIEQTKDVANTVIAGIDKDLLQCPGWHYSATKDAFAYIDETLGTRMLYRQILSGDPTDNVGGVYKLGVTKAKKIVDREALRWLQTADGGGQSLASWLYDTALFEYEASINKYGDDTGYLHLGPAAALEENARLVYMLRSEDDKWEEPKE